ncbi:hypothetical protein [Stutzerimonas chloritidismutans]
MTGPDGQLPTLVNLESRREQGIHDLSCGCFLLEANCIEGNHASSQEGEAAPVSLKALHVKFIHSKQLRFEVLRCKKIKTGLPKEGLK